jgi:hypothetical protein
MKRIHKQLALSVHTLRDLSAGLPKVTGGGQSKKCPTNVSCVAASCTVTTTQPTLTM